MEPGRDTDPGGYVFPPGARAALASILSNLALADVPQEIVNAYTLAFKQSDLRRSLEGDLEDLQRELACLRVDNEQLRNTIVGLRQHLAYADWYKRLGRHLPWTFPDSTIAAPRISPVSDEALLEPPPLRLTPPSEDPAEHPYVGERPPSVETDRVVPLDNELMFDNRGQRIDPPAIAYNKAIVERLKSLKLCNAHHMRGHCPKAASCRHDHQYKLTNEERQQMVNVSRSSPCLVGPRCQDTSCIYAHQCPYPADFTKGNGANGYGCIKGSACRFSAEMHNRPCHTFVRFEAQLESSSRGEAAGLEHGKSSATA